MRHKADLTPRQRILDGLSILVCLGTLIYIAVMYRSLPQQIASRFDASGNITGYQGKSMLILLGFFMVFLVTFPLSVLLRIRKLYKAISTPWPVPKGQEGRITELTKDFICIVNLMITIMFAYLMICCMHSMNPGVLVWLPIAAMTIALIVLLAKMRNICKKPRDRDPWET